MYALVLQVRLETDQAAIKQKEAEAATAAQERDTLRNKLKILQDQILRSDQAGSRHAAAPKVSIGSGSAAVFDLCICKITHLAQCFQEKVCPN